MTIATTEPANEAPPLTMDERRALESAREVIWLFRRGYTLGDPLMDQAMREFATADGGYYNPR